MTSDGGRGKTADSRLQTADRRQQTADTKTGGLKLKWEMFVLVEDKDVGCYDVNKEFLTTKHERREMGMGQEDYRLGQVSSEEVERDLRAR